MNEENEEKLKRAIEDLPQFEPSSNVWNKIEADLSFDEELKVQLTTLPEFDPRLELWGSIEQKLDTSDRKYSIYPWVTYGVAVAASLILMIGIFKFFSKQNDFKITYSEEWSWDDEQKEEQEDSLRSEFDVFIAQSCNYLPEKCKTTEFYELKQQFYELDKEMAMINQAIKNYGKDPDLIKSQIKIENQKAEVAKDIVKILTI